MDPEKTEAGYEPPEICDIATTDDREFHVVPGEPGGSENDRN